jgi:hypothetical protein
MEEMQGIMTLPQGGAAPQPTADPQQEALFETLRQQVPPKEFADQLLGAAAQADPQAVDAFIKELQALEVPLETLMLLNEMVDAILANPQDYARIRRQYMEQGVTEDVLPERFDPMFFAALNMALDQMTMKQPSPMGMAGGGIADLAQYGRHGDTMLAHITPEEAALLKSRGGSGTINPVTGLPEFFIGKLFKAIGNAVKKFAQSTIGRIVLPIALGFFLGPAAAGFLGATSTAAVAAVSGFVGGAGAALLRGESLGDALKQGAIGGVTAGAGAGIMGGAEAFTAGSYTGPTTVGGQFDRFIEGTKTLVAPAQAAQPALPSVQELAAGNPSLAQPAGFDYVSGAPLSADAAPVQVGAPLAPRSDIPSAPIEGVSPLGSQSSGQTFALRPTSYSANAAGNPSLAQPAGFDYVSGAPLSADAASVQAGANAANSMYAEPGSAAFDAMSKPLSELNVPPPGNMPPPPSPNTEPGFMDKAKGLYDKYLNPKTLGEVPQDVINKADQAYTDTLRRTGSEARALREYDRIIKAGTPGILSTYGPLAAAGLAATAALGGFKSTPAAAPDFSKFDMGNPAYAKPLYFGGLQGSTGYRPRNYLDYMPVKQAADGGIMALEMGGTTYPRKQGHIKGPGTGTSDSIPALLSDGEFVFTAKSVRNLGNGSRRKGAKRLYAMMKMLEERKV